MASFYSATGNLNNNNNDGSGGASGGDDGGNTGNNQGFLQPQQQSQQQPGFSQWQPKPEGHGQDQGQPYGQQQQQQQQTQQQSTPQPFWSPNNAQQMATQAAAGFVAQAATGNFTSEKVLTQGYDQIQKAFGGGIPGMDYIMRSLRSYFAVDNRYVKRKIVIILFPFRNKHWSRNQVEGSEMVNYALPHSDENAPDLYLPVMSLVTYCLLSAFLYGTAGQFNPEVIADVITKCFITQVAEVLIIRGCLYTMQTAIPFLDLFSYTGYKYLGLTISILCGIIFKRLEWGRSSFYIAFLWTASAAAWFMLKTMANNIPTETASAGPKRDVVVLAFAASQIATMWFVSQTKYL
mmetsp:Transcript_6483/g.6965  ORF Transcript_6483/g.6965 Transcript_6483/m.6965 type:complete len:349 (+) Transcript_6483:65-1111(+)